jgi:hypothetical protein
VEPEPKLITVPVLVRSRNRNRNLSKVGTGTVKNSYGFATLPVAALYVSLSYTLVVFQWVFPGSGEFLAAGAGHRHAPQPARHQFGKFFKPDEDDIGLPGRKGVSCRGDAARNLLSVRR